ncbi:MAG: GIY-YIG nuclease family protein [Magnetococcales bacterium]|nr:GIY-YIG nuclease family protein [Magnetococcales bacterium]
MATYLLNIFFTHQTAITVGAWGLATIGAGRYLYVGSAKRAWQKRVGRHFSDDKKVRWHVDYLLMNSASQLRSAWVSMADRECEIARMLLDNGLVDAPFKRLGASDCRCPAHFVRVCGEQHQIMECLQSEGFYLWMPEST